MVLLSIRADHYVPSSLSHQAVQSRLDTTFADERVAGVFTHSFY